MIPTSKPSIVALIPARTGSKRVPGKNTRLLGGKPLVAHTVIAAQDSGIFRSVHVCTDDWYLIRSAYNVGIIGRKSVPDDQPDIVWVRAALEQIPDMPDAFAILRPTAPFRTAETIRLAWKVFLSTPCDSLRAVRYAKENPFKMWQPHDGVIEPLVEERDTHGTPWHSLPSQQTMGTLYVQTGGLEMAWSRVVHATPPTISGDRVIPFHLEGDEALDINTEADWDEAERILEMRGLTGKQPLEYLG